MPIAPIDEQTAVDYVVAGEPGGDHPDLVLIHGTGGTAESNWLHLIQALSPGRRIIAPNLAGAGKTTDHGGQLELDELVAQVDAATVHAGSQRYDIVGFSLGAVVGAQLAADRPERVRRLILIAGWMRSDGRVQLQFDLWRRLHETDRESLAELLTLTGFSANFLAKRPAEVVRRMVGETAASIAPGIARQAELDQRVDLTQTVGQIKASTLVIGCREDQMVPVEHARSLVAPIRWSDYLEFDCGHLVIFEKPAELAEAVLRFLNKPDRRSAPRD